MKTSRVFTSNLPKTMWSEASASMFKVRGKNYMQDGKKIPAKDALFHLVGVDVFSFEQAGDEYDLGSCHHSCVYGSETFTLIINFIVPGTEKVALVFYFQPKSNELVHSDEGVLYSFVHADDDGYRNDRLKMIPTLVEGNYVLKKAVGSRPILIGQKLDVKYTRGPNYFEIDNDLSTDWMANKVVGMLRGVLESLILQVAFVIQADHVEDLPEQLLGAVRLQHVAVDQPQRIPARNDR